MKPENYKPALMDIIRLSPCSPVRYQIDGILRTGDLLVHEIRTQIEYTIHADTKIYPA